MAANVPNDGSQSITVPNLSTSTARLKVEAVGNIFFDLSNTNLTINPFFSANTPPSFVTGPDQDVSDEGGPQTVVGWATDISVGPPAETGQLLLFAVSNNNNGLFAAPLLIDSTGNLTFTPAFNVRGVALMTVTLQDSGGTENGGQDTSSAQTFTINIAKPHLWHNVAKPFDVNGGLNNTPDDHIVAGDALAIINYLNAFGAGPVSANASVGLPFGFVDTSGGPSGAGDNFITAGDALDVINFLNAFGADGEGESQLAQPGVSVPSANDMSLSPYTAAHLDDLVALLALDVTLLSPKRRIHRP